MEDWELDFHWLKTRNVVAKSLGTSSLPDLKGILFLIGLQELGNITRQTEYSKEEKQDLMHVAVCVLLEGEGYYEYIGRDQDGWPHWKTLIPFTLKGVKEQELFIKVKVIQYFDEEE